MLRLLKSGGEEDSHSKQTETRAGQRSRKHIRARGRKVPTGTSLTAFMKLQSVKTMTRMPLVLLLYASAQLGE